MVFINNPICIASPTRIKQCDRLDNLFYYDVRHADEDGFEPVELKKSILANHMCTIATKKPIELDIHGYYVLNEEESEMILNSI